MANKAVLGVAAAAAAGYQLNEMVKSKAREREMQEEEEERERREEAWLEDAQKRNRSELELLGDAGQNQMLAKIKHQHLREVMEKLGERAKAAHGARGAGLALPYVGHAGDDTPNSPEEVLLGVALVNGDKRLLGELLEDIRLSPGVGVAQLTPPTLRLVDEFLSETVQMSLLSNRPSKSNACATVKSLGSACTQLKALLGLRGDPHITSYELEGVRDSSLSVYELAILSVTQRCAQRDAIRACAEALGLHAYPEHVFKHKLSPDKKRVTFKPPQRMTQSHWTACGGASTAKIM